MYVYVYNIIYIRFNLVHRAHRTSGRANMHLTRAQCTGRKVFLHPFDGLIIGDFSDFPPASLNSEG